MKTLQKCGAANMVRFFLSAMKEGGTSSTTHTHRPQNKSTAKKIASIVGNLSFYEDDAGLVMKMMMMINPSGGRRSMGFWVGSLVGHVKVVNLLIYAAGNPKKSRVCECFRALNNLFRR